MCIQMKFLSIPISATSPCADNIAPSVEDLTGGGAGMRDIRETASSFATDKSSFCCRGGTIRRVLRACDSRGPTFADDLFGRKDHLGFYKTCRGARSQRAELGRIRYSLR